MCGIVGFTGTQQAAPILLNGLSKLEYRGYDSAGIAVRDGERLAQVVKAKGRLSNLIEKTDEGKALIGTCGIGHTRWATHGEPSQINAHPHVSGNCTRSGSGEVESEVVGVHNGIIENYTELKEKLLKQLQQINQLKTAPTLIYISHHPDEITDIFTHLLLTLLPGSYIDLHEVMWSRKFSIRQNMEIYRHLLRYFVARIPHDT